MFQKYGTFNFGYQFWFWDPITKFFKILCNSILIIIIFIIYLWSKVLCFVSYLWNPLNQNASDFIPGFLGKLSKKRGALAWFHGIWTCGAKVLEYWIIFSLKIKLNFSWKCQRNWNVPLVLLERSWWARFNGIYLVRFGFRLWDLLTFKWFLLLKIQMNSKKTKFWKEKLVEDMATLGQMAHATLVYIERSMSIFIVYIGIIRPMFRFDYTNFKAPLVINIIIFNENF